MDTYSNKKKVIGIDVSLNRTTYGIIDVRGNILASGRFRTKDYNDIEDYINILCKNLEVLINDNGGFGMIHAIGVSCPSGNYTTGCIENSPNMPWKGVIPLAAMMRDRLAIEVALINNCKAVAMGEWAFGAAHGMSNFCIISLGHGMGSAYYVDGKLVNGNSGLAGEFGHSCAVPHGRHCECGLDGCLETYVAEKGIIRTAHELMAESDAPSLMRDIPDEIFTPKMITKCCEKGDEMAKEVYRRTGEILGRSMATLASVLDPQVIIVSGGIAKAGMWLLEPAEDSFNEHLFNNIRGHVSIVMSSISGGECDMLGASVMAWSLKEYSLFK